MEETQKSQKNESITKTAVTQPQVVVTPEVVSPQQKATIERTESGSLKKYGKVFLFINVILILGLAVMGVTYWRMSQERTSTSPTPTPTSSPTPGEETDAQTSALEEQGTSDEIEDVESDLNATDLSEIDKELEDIEGELAAP